MIFEFHFITSTSSNSLDFLSKQLRCTGAIELYEIPGDYSKDVSPSEPSKVKLTFDITEVVDVSDRKNVSIYIFKS